MKLLEDVNRIVKVESWSFAFYEGKTIDVTLQQIEGYTRSNGKRTCFRI